MNAIIQDAHRLIAQLDLSKLDKKLSNLVETLTAKRVSNHSGAHSHGYAHLERVSRLALYIATTNYITEPVPNFYVYVLICAWFHDLVDSKYPADIALNTQVIIGFITDNTLCDWRLVLEIIKRVSFSHEQKYGDEDWSRELGKFGTMVRDVVSDADKLDALGAAGVHRCRAYVMETHPDLDDAEINALVLEHADYKLLRLAGEFMRTDVGRKLAVPLHDEMRAELDELKV